MASGTIGKGGLMAMEANGHRTNSHRGLMATNGKGANGYEG